MEYVLMESLKKYALFALVFIIGVFWGGFLMYLFTDFKMPQSLNAFLGIILGSSVTYLYNRFLSKQSFKQQLLLSNLDKKLNAHQEAFSKWWEIRSNIYERDKIFDVVEDATEWWKNNCLYLFPNSRMALYDCLIFATNHKNLIEYKNDSYNYKIAIEESWDIITAPGKIIPEEIDIKAFEDQDKLFNVKSPNDIK